MKPLDQFIDIGVNLADSSFAKDRVQVVEEAVTAGIQTMILTGTSAASSEEALALTRAYPAHCYATAGVHPHDAKDVDQGTLATLRDLAVEERVVAIGETGLDFNRDFSPRPTQEMVFEQQLELAIELNMPLFCHERDAGERFYQIIRHYRDDIQNAVVHCFTGSKKDLYRYLDLDLHIGITGWICDERRGTHLQPLLRDIPANRLMLETDAPYLMPRTIKPKPKSRRNVPANLLYVAAAVAEHTGKTVSQIAKETTATATAFFNLQNHQ